MVVYLSYARDVDLLMGEMNVIRRLLSLIEI